MWKNMNFWEQPGPARIVMHARQSWTSSCCSLQQISGQNWSSTQTYTNCQSTIVYAVAWHNSHRVTSFHRHNYCDGCYSFTRGGRLLVDWQHSSTSVVFGTALMSRTRFRHILRYFHVADNALPKTDDKLCKVRPIVDRLNASFLQMYNPSQCLSVDESMVGTKCWMSFLQYMPKKTKKFSIKLWALCESATGYCLQFQVYTGKAETDMCWTYRVVFYLLKKYLNLGYKVFMDNFYSSYHLFVDLLNQRTGACGTICSNRFAFPKDLQGKKKMKKGEATFLHCDNITAVRWFDKRDVYAISTLHGNEMVTVPPKNPSSEQITKPKLIVDYNENMNGVDRCDQLLVYYALNRKTTKWWKCLFFFICWTWPL